jgi:hypothetical protein
LKRVTFCKEGTPFEFKIPSLRLIFMKYALAAFILTVSMIPGASAQTAAHVTVAGSITAVNAADNQVTVKSEKGEATTLTITPRSNILRLPAGETETKNAVKIAFGDLAAGDLVVASYQPSGDGKIMETRTLMVRTKADVAEINQKDDEDWRKRGTTGNLTALDAAAKTFTFKAGSKDITVKPTAKTEYLRYSPDSAKSSDAKPSSFADLKPGDEIHVLGNKNAEGTEIEAEKVVFGYFPQIAATIKSVNAAGNELVVTDLATKKPITIRIIPDSIMKKLPDVAAQALARRYGAARGGDASAGGRGAGRGAGPGGPGGGRGGDPGQMLEHAPAIALTDLKPGDAIMVKTTAGRGTGPGTAVMLIAGVEPILTAAPNSTRDIMAGWSLGGGGGGDGN